MRTLLFFALLLAGCIAAAPLGLDDWDTLGATERRTVAQRLLAESDVTAFARQRYALEVPGGGPVPVVGGFVPGRVPGLRSELVVVPVALDGPWAAPLLDAASAIARRARFGQEPARSVLVGWWPEGGDESDVLALPVWPRENRRTLLRVTGGGAFGAAPDSLVLATVRLDAALSRDTLSARLQRAILAAADTTTVR